MNNTYKSRLMRLNSRAYERNYVQLHEYWLENVRDMNTGEPYNSINHKHRATMKHCKDNAYYRLLLDREWYLSTLSATIINSPRSYVKTWLKRWKKKKKLLFDTGS